MHVTEMMNYDWSTTTGRLRFNVSACCSYYEFIVYVAFSHVYFRRQKFLFQTHMVRKIGAENRRQKMESI